MATDGTFPQIVFVFLYGQFHFENDVGHYWFLLPVDRASVALQAFTKAHGEVISTSGHFSVCTAAGLPLPSIVLSLSQRLSIEELTMVVGRWQLLREVVTFVEVRLRQCLF